MKKVLAALLSLSLIWSSSSLAEASLSASSASFHPAILASAPLFASNALNVPEAFFARLVSRRPVMIIVLSLLIMLGALHLQAQTVSATPSAIPPPSNSYRFSAIDLQNELARIDALKEVNGAPIELIERQLRPGPDISEEAFMGIDDSFKEVLKNDLKTLYQLGLTPTQLAAHIRLILIKSKSEAEDNYRNNRSFDPAHIQYDPKELPGNTLESHGPQSLAVTYRPIMGIYFSPFRSLFHTPFERGPWNTVDSITWGYNYYITNEKTGVTIRVSGQVGKTPEDDRGMLGFMEHLGFFGGPGPIIEGTDTVSHFRIDPETAVHLITGQSAPVRTPKTPKLKPKPTPQAPATGQSSDSGSQQEELAAVDSLTEINGIPLEEIEAQVHSQDFNVVTDILSYLGEGDSIKEVIKEDLRTLHRLGLSSAQLAAHLRRILVKANNGNDYDPRHITYDPKELPGNTLITRSSQRLTVTMERIRGQYRSPFTNRETGSSADNFGWSDIFTIKNERTGVTIILSTALSDGPKDDAKDDAGMLGFIERHQFFGGVGGSFRIDPESAVALLTGRPAPKPRHPKIPPQPAKPTSKVGPPTQTAIGEEVSAHAGKETFKEIVKEEQAVPAPEEAVALFRSMVSGLSVDQLTKLIKLGETRSLAYVFELENDGVVTRSDKVNFRIAYEPGVVGANGMEVKMDKGGALLLNETQQLDILRDILNQKVKGSPAPPKASPSATPEQKNQAARQPTLPKYGRGGQGGFYKGALPFWIGGGLLAVWGVWGLSFGAAAVGLNMMAVIIGLALIGLGFITNHSNTSHARSIGIVASVLEDLTNGERSEPAVGQPNPSSQIEGVGIQIVLDHLDQLIAAFRTAASSGQGVPDPSRNSFLEIYSNGFELKPVGEWPSAFSSFAGAIHQAWDASYGNFQNRHDSNLRNLAHNLGLLRDAIQPRGTAQGAAHQESNRFDQYLGQYAIDVLDGTAPATLIADLEAWRSVFNAPEVADRAYAKALISDEQSLRQFFNYFNQVHVIVMNRFGMGMLSGHAYWAAILSEIWDRRAGHIHSEINKPQEALFGYLIDALTGRAFQTYVVNADYWRTDILSDPGIHDRAWKKWLVGNDTALPQMLDLFRQLAEEISPRFPNGAESDEFFGVMLATLVKTQMAAQSSATRQPPASGGRFIGGGALKAIALFGLGGLFGTLSMHAQSIGHQVQGQSAPLSHESWFAYYGSLFLVGAAAGLLALPFIRKGGMMGRLAGILLIAIFVNEMIPLFSAHAPSLVAVLEASAVFGGIALAWLLRRLISRLRFGNPAAGQPQKFFGRPIALIYGRPLYRLEASVILLGAFVSVATAIVMISLAIASGLTYSIGAVVVIVIALGLAPALRLLPEYFAYKKLKKVASDPTSAIGQSQESLYGHADVREVKPAVSPVAEDAMLAMEAWRHSTQISQNLGEKPLPQLFGHTKLENPPAAGQPAQQKSGLHYAVPFLIGVLTLSVGVPLILKGAFSGPAISIGTGIAVLVGGLIALLVTLRRPYIPFWENSHNPVNAAA